ncbi:MAG: polysaccharide deacetylase family protein [Nitrospira sp.]|nr:polysaccharide deacetylase family protein [Nitrospira sp.]
MSATRTVTAGTPAGVQRSHAESQPRILQKQAFVHVDMDGLAAIHQAHGSRYAGKQDAFYVSAVEHSLLWFERQGITATYFVIGDDLHQADKRRAVECVVRAGHKIACHSLTHRSLMRLSSMDKREEIASGKKVIEDVLGVECQGFRAPGYSIDYESLEILREVGYRYDSSVFPTNEFRERLGLQRLFPEPFLMFPEGRLFEFPMPHPGPWLPPFHPCYAFYLTRFYFYAQLRTFSRRYNYLTCLFHLTDFSARQPELSGLRLQLYSNNFFSSQSKLRFLDALFVQVKQEFTLTTSEDFISDWPRSAPDLNPRTILGISTTHETGACVVRDGTILSAVNEERLSRIKLDDAFPPTRSIREALQVAGINPKEIDAVAVSGLEPRDLLPRIVESLKRDVTDFHSWNDYVPHFCRVAYRAFCLWRAMKYDALGQFLEAEYGIQPKVHYVEHHESHASAAFRTSAASKALILIADGVGDELSITISRGEGSTIRRTAQMFYPNSFGQFYTACTQILGFKGGRHEGKITGLAGYGRSVPDLIEKVERTFRSEEGRFTLHKRYYAEGFIRPKFRELLAGKMNLLTVEYRNYKQPLKKLLQGYKREDVAYAFQFLMEREVVRLAKNYLAGERLPLVVAGGVMANVKLNMALAEQLDIDSFYVFPNMGDGGLCVGAALSLLAAEPRPVRDMYLGTRFTEADCLEALKHYPQFHITKPDCLADVVARALAERKIVARCDGRMEFGPRALGNRSILYHCGDKSVNDWLNQQLHRTEFMPFAPMALYEDREQYFEIRKGSERACEFMTLVVGCTDTMRRLCPAAVHIDGTARPQLVRREINPEMHAILSAYRNLTGMSVLINTSFNMHEEPIVRSPEEAILAFQQSHLHHLVLGPFFVSQGHL